VQVSVTPIGYPGGGTLDSLTESIRRQLTWFSDPDCQGTAIESYNPFPNGGVGAFFQLTVTQTLDTAFVPVNSSFEVQISSSIFHFSDGTQTECRNHTPQPMVIWTQPTVTEYSLPSITPPMSFLY
jgi:hypothetical protein